MLDEHGRLLDQQRLPASREGYQALRQWAGRWPQRCWAVEGAHGVGRALAQRLVTDGEHVVDVPAKLAARVRVLSTGHGRKSDPDDAVSIAVAVQSAPGLRQVAVEDWAVLLHLLTNRREDLAGRAWLADLGSGQPEDDGNQQWRGRPWCLRWVIGGWGRRLAGLSRP